MKTFNDYINIYTESLAQGDIKEAYNRLMDYLNDLRLHLKNKYPAYKVPGHIYEGRMQISFFTCSPESLRHEKLKITIVFVHENPRFDIWLVGQNKNIQAKYWKMFKESDWDEYRIPKSIKGIYSIVEHTLVEKPNFNDLDALTQQIEREVIKFITDIENIFIQ